MKYFIGWLVFLVVVIGFGIGGYFLIKNMNTDAFKYKNVVKVDYNDYNINDFVVQDIACNSKGCTYKKKEVVYSFSEVDTLGKQDITLNIKYDGKEYNKTFKVEVVDRESPKITLKNLVEIIKPNEEFKPEDYIEEVTDNYDTLSVEDILIDSQVDNKKEGEYEVIYKVKDSSDNERVATLKVKVSKNIEVVPNNTEELNKDKKFEWDFKTTGLLNLSHKLSNNNLKMSTDKDITLGWDSTLKISSIFMGSTKYRVTLIISDKEIKDTSNLDSDLYLKVIDKDITGINYDFSYEFEEGKYYIYIRVVDKENNVTGEEYLTLNLKYPEELEDIEITSEPLDGDGVTYQLVCVEGLGGDGVFDEVTIDLKDSDDPKFKTSKEMLVNEVDNVVGCLLLNPTKGYSYEFTASVVEKGKTYTDTYTFKK